MSNVQGYFKNERKEVGSLVENSAKTILDVGCGYGLLGAALKSDDPSRKIVGIELDANASKEARKVLDDVLNVDIENFDLSATGLRFDCIICADILEHLKDPLAVLRRLKSRLNESGSVVCSIPNMRHYTVFLHLLTKGWEYEDFGLFDRTHLRFFSLHSIKLMISEAGLSIETVNPYIVASKKMKLLNTLLFNKLEDFLAMQYVIKARYK